MSREWKPGDVAIGYDDRWEIRVVRYGGTPDYWAAANGRWPIGVAADSLDYRPVVVIDPEDREQINALDEQWAKGMRWLQGDSSGARRRRDILQAALRSLVTPPKPPEPTGLGAVVEDEKGRRWVYSPTGTCIDPWQGIDRRRHWSQITAVKVLSEGVPQ